VARARGAAPAHAKLEPKDAATSTERTTERRPSQVAPSGPVVSHATGTQTIGPRSQQYAPSFKVARFSGLEPQGPDASPSDGNW
jgi:hypothetical protein